MIVGFKREEFKKYLILCKANEFSSDLERRIGVCFQREKFGDSLMIRTHKRFGIVGITSIIQVHSLYTSPERVWFNSP